MLYQHAPPGRKRPKDSLRPRTASMRQLPSYTSADPPILTMGKGPLEKNLQFEKKNQDLVKLPKCTFRTPPQLRTSDNAKSRQKTHTRTCRCQSRKATNPPCTSRLTIRGTFCSQDRLCLQQDTFHERGEARPETAPPGGEARNSRH